MRELLTCATWSKQEKKEGGGRRRLASALLLGPPSAPPVLTPLPARQSWSIWGRAAVDALRAESRCLPAERCLDLGRPGPRRRRALPGLLVARGIPAGWAQGAAPLGAPAKGRAKSRSQPTAGRRPQRTDRLARGQPRGGGSRARGGCGGQVKGRVGGAG